MRKVVTSYWSVMGTEQCIATNIFKNVLNCSLSYGHSIISWSSTTKLIDYNQWRRCRLFQNSMSLLEFNVKSWFSWDLVNNYLLWFYQRIQFYKISDQIRLFDIFHKVNNFLFELKLLVNKFVSIRLIFHPCLDRSITKISLHWS